MEISFREYHDTDYQKLLELTVKLTEYVKSLDSLSRIKNLPGFAKLSVDDLFNNIKNNKGIIWFILVQDKVIGFVTGVIWKQTELNKLEIGEHTQGEILDIYLEEEFRDKGIGQKVIKKMEEYFLANGCKSMWAGVFAENSSARIFYKSSGFIEREIGMLKQL